MEHTQNSEGRREAKPMEFSAQSVVYLNETRKWTIFLSILGFIFLGLILLVALFTGTILSTLATDSLPFPGAGIGLSLIYVLIGALYFFPIFYLYKFSTLSKQAIYNENSEDLTLAFKYLKKHYRFIGIFTIVMLSLYILVFLIAGIAGGIGAMM